MKTNQNGPQHEDDSQEPSAYKSYGEYQILDSDPGSNLQFSDEDDDENFYFSFNDFAADQDFEE